MGRFIVTNIKNFIWNKMFFIFFCELGIFLINLAIATDTSSIYVKSLCILPLLNILIILFFLIEFTNKKRTYLVYPWTINL